MDFKFYFSLFLRRIHWFLLFFVIGSAVGLTLARILPTVYTAQAQLLVQSEEIPANLAQSTVQTEATEQLQIIQQRILTRNTLIDMANRLEIYGAPGSPDHALVFAATVDGLQIQGCDFLRTNDAGLIEEFTVMLRPLKAVQAFAGKMGAAFQAAMAAGVEDGTS